LIAERMNSNALLLLLNIVHLKFKGIPTTLPYHQLLNVAVLVDQYNCRDLVRPWLNMWLADEEKESKAPEHENWLFIAWAFGREKVFEDLAMKMVEDIVISDGGHLTNLFCRRCLWILSVKSKNFDFTCIAASYPDFLATIPNFCPAIRCGQH